MKHINPASINGTVRVPGSKSYMQRVTLAAALSDEPIIIDQPDFCNDSLSMLSVVQQLGARVERKPNQVRITPHLQSPDGTVYCGESGLCMRMMTAVLGLLEQDILLTGHAHLLKRPLPAVESPLHDLGVQIETHAGYPPARIKGPYQGGRTIVNGSLSSQFLSGLLMALPRSAANSLIIAENLTSIPYIDITLDVLQKFGVQIRHRDYREFNITGGQSYHCDRIAIEGDWSAAAFWMAAAAMGGRVTIHGLNPDSVQGDKRIIEIVTRTGARVFWENQILHCEGSKPVPFEADLTECPDLFPPLTALAAGTNGISRLYGCHRLTHKESNRARVLTEEFRKLGVNVYEQNDSLVIHGGHIRGGKGLSHNDHRIAMALAISGLHSEQGITIEGDDSVKKSYPLFFDHLQNLTGGKQ